MSAPGKWQPWDWYGISRKLVHVAYLKPWEIERLTEPEILLCLDDDFTTRRPPTAGTPLHTHEDVLAYVQTWRNMTPQERLQRALEED